MINKRIEAAAWLIDTTEDRLIDHRDYGDRVVVIGPDGKKFSFTDEQIQKAIKAMQLPTLKEAIPKERSRPETYNESLPLERVTAEASATARAHVPEPQKGAAKRRGQPKK